MQPEIAGEIISALEEAGVDFVATLTEANLHELVMALAEEKGVHHVPVSPETITSRTSGLPLRLASVWLWPCRTAGW